MSLNEILLFIFTDELVGLLLFPLKEKYVLDATLLINNSVNPLLLFFVAFLGSNVGLVLNYALARVVEKGLNLQLKFPRKVILIIYASLIFLTFSYFGSIVVFLAGFAKLPFKRFYLISTIYLALYFLLRSLIFIF